MANDKPKSVIKKGKVNDDRPNRKAWKKKHGDDPPIKQSQADHNLYVTNRTRKTQIANKKRRRR